MRKLISTWVVLALLVACGGKNERDAPVQALLAFMAAVERSTHEPGYREQAYAWLDQASREELQRRALLARSLAGRELEGWEMLVPGRITVGSRDLGRRGLRARIEGDRATVALGEGGDAVLVREPEGWRVSLLGLPPAEDAEPAP